MGQGRKRSRTQDLLGAAHEGLGFARRNYAERRQIRGESPQFSAAWSKASFINGWLQRGEAELLFELAAAVPAGQDIVEVGSYLGRSTAFIALGAGPSRKVHAVDPRTTEQFRENMEKLGVTDIIQAHVALSVDAARAYEGNPVGLLFVDAVHTEAAVFEDGLVWSSHLAPGCCVVFDDVNKPEVATGVKRLVADGVLPEFVGRVGKVGVCGAPGHLPARVLALAGKG